MSKKNLSLISILIILILILIGIYFVFGDWSEKVIFTISSHIFVGPLLLILWRIIGIIFPAIPAGVVSFAVVPIFGWFKTYIYTVTGILIGTSISFFLARKFGEPLAERFVPIKKLHRLEDKLTEKQKFLGIVALRLFTVPVMDFSSYAAGLTRISFPKFFLVFQVFAEESTFEIETGFPAIHQSILKKLRSFSAEVLQKKKEENSQTALPEALDIYFEPLEHF